MEKRQLPTRNNFLTEAVRNLLESRTKVSNEPSFDGKSILTVTSNEEALEGFTSHSIPTPPVVTLPDDIATRTFKMIEPVRAIKGSRKKANADEYYMKRHRKNEMNEKKQKNREKEELRYGYHHQMLLVDRLKAMDKSILQSIVSTIRHRKDQKEQDDIDEIYKQLLDESMDILRRYESLGFHSTDTPVTTATTAYTTTMTTTTTTAATVATTNNPETHQETRSEETPFQKSLKTQKKRITPTKVLDHPKVGTRRSTRTVTAFGQKLPSFDNHEFELPSSILDFKKEDNE